MYEKLEMWANAQRDGRQSPQYKNVTDSTDRQDTTDRQRSESLGQTVLQTVRPKTASCIVIGLSVIR